MQHLNDTEGSCEASGSLTSEVHEGHRREGPVGIRSVQHHPASDQLHVSAQPSQNTEALQRQSSLHLNTKAEQKMKLCAGGTDCLLMSAGAASPLVHCTQEP